MVKKCKAPAETPFGRSKLVARSVAEPRDPRESPERSSELCVGKGTFARSPDRAGEGSDVHPMDERSMNDADEERRDSPAVLEVVRVGDAVVLEAHSGLDLGRAEGEIAVAAVGERALRCV